MTCVNTNSAEFQTLLKLSGLPDFYLAAFCGNFVEIHGRFPYLDEIHGADSTKYLTKLLKIKHNAASILDILNMTGTSSIEEALIFLNNNFRDVEVELFSINDFSARIYITKRPVSKEISKNIDHSPYITSGILFEKILNKLKNLNGINYNIVDTETIQNSDLKNIPGAATAKAFIFLGEIYINTDLSDKDAPIHEMMHMLMGGLRTLNPELYYEITQAMVNLPVFKQYSENYPNRTLSDIAEEVFVGEFAKLASYGTSSLSELPSTLQYELFYHAKRVLDTILMGESSVKDVADIITFNRSLIELCDMVGSPLDAGNFRGKLELDAIHRTLANKKQELMENNELEEHCNG